MHKGRAKNGRDLCDNAQPKASASSAIDIVFLALLECVNNVWAEIIYAT